MISRVIDGWRFVTMFRPVQSMMVFTITVRDAQAVAGPEGANSRTRASKCNVWRRRPRLRPFIRPSTFALPPAPRSSPAHQPAPGSSHEERSAFFPAAPRAAILRPSNFRRPCRRPADMVTAVYIGILPQTVYSASGTGGEDVWCLYVLCSARQSGGGRSLAHCSYVRRHQSPASGFRSGRCGLRSPPNPHPAHGLPRWV